MARDPSGTRGTGTTAELRGDRAAIAEPSAVTPSTVIRRVIDRVAAVAVPVLSRDGGTREPSRRSIPSEGYVSSARVEAGNPRGTGRTVSTPFASMNDALLTILTIAAPATVRTASTYRLGIIGVSGSSTLATTTPPSTTIALITHVASPIASRRIRA